MRSRQRRRGRGGRCPSLLTDVSDLAHAVFGRLGIGGEVFLHHRAKSSGIVTLRPAEPRRGIAVEIVRSGNAVAHGTKIRLVGLVVPDLAHPRGAAAAGRVIRSGDRLPIVENDNVGRCGDRRVGLRLLGVDSPVDLVLDRRVHVEGACGREMLVRVGTRRDCLSLYRGKLGRRATADLERHYTTKV